MIGRVLLDTGDVHVTLSFLGKLKVTLAKPYPRTYVATSVEKAYFFAASDAFEKRGKLDSNNSDFAEFVEEFAFAVSDRGGVTWQAIFVGTEQGSWARIRRDSAPNRDPGYQPSFSEYRSQVYKDVKRELDSDGHTANGLPVIFDVEIEAFLTANGLFEIRASWSQRPKVTFLEERGWFGSVNYEITRLGTPEGDGEYYRVSVETRSDGSLRVNSHGMGPVADNLSGGRGDIEAFLTLNADQVRDLYGAIGGWSDDKSVRPALCLAIGFAIKFSGAPKALSAIEEFCLSKDIKPERLAWF